ncbi:non-ribosomal peptide synthetase [Micromonospora andamanensis]|uniref:Phenyloxazoline synthase MbtB n=1 Tax=Micromonospora andamanensis TaxID=1287068 RepID=A0ABQ4HTC9_9ACTN|nr:non-ribosomal peptide synthetase [Micromonospora andamanensis]GIJ08918.1 non-ribosomal peptide synthetase [Micromonospora andamanensis]
MQNPTDASAVTLADIRRDVADLLGCPPTQLDDDSDLLHLGLDSISVMRLAAGWQAAGVPVTYGDLFQWRTVRQWWDLMSALPGSAVPAAPPPVDPVDATGAFPLATMQHAYWVGRSDGVPLGGVGAHFCNEFDGEGVEPGRLERAVHALIRRHPMLRAAFADAQQRVLPDSTWRLTVHDLRDLSPAQRDEALLRVRDHMSHRRLRVEVGEVFDVQLSLLPDGATRVHVQIEMLVADAHSFRVLLADLAALYLGRDDRLAPLGLTFPGYLASTGADQPPADDVAYWRDRQDSLPGPPQLPLATAPAAVHGHRVGRRHRSLDPAAATAVRETAHRHGLTPAVAFLNAFADVLATFSADDRFVLGLPRYDRRPVHPDVGAVVGDFTNLVLLEVDVAGCVTFAGRAAALQEQLRRDLAHGGVSGVEVLRQLARLRGTGAVGAPVVFTSALSLGDLFAPEVRRCFGTPGWTTSQTPQVWLDFQVTEREGGLLLNWDVVEELFPPGLVDAMFQAYSHLVDRLVTEPDWERTLPVVLDPAVAARRAAVNATDTPVRERRLHDDFFAYADRHPDRVALCGTDGCWHYGELARRADALAATLTSRGLADGDSVAVTLPKGFWQVAAVLAVLRAGGVYVPVGPDQPAPRRAAILARAGARLAITADADTEPVVETVPQAGPTATHTAAARTDPPAYVLFTSGSTGEPKGVEVGHRAALNTIDDLTRRFAVGPDDRLISVSALDFDLSVFDIFGALGTGASLAVLGEQERRDVAAWCRLVTDWRVTVWQSVPLLLDALLSTVAERGGLVPLRLALVGGDWVGPELSARLARVAPEARLIALGGTTETAIHSTIQEVPPVPPAHWSAVPYGRPLANQRLRVVDRRGDDRPDWVPGELWIGGASVACGYRGDPALTADRFVTGAGLRWYRTGDLARWWPDGTVEFLGRADHQIKLRGHRIEPGEIEAVLRACPEVNDAVVVAVGAAAHRRLAAAVVPSDGTETVDPQALHEWVRDRLPAAMAPQSFVVLAALPSSANGKVDRRRIADLLAAAPTRPVHRDPVGAREQRLAELWAGLIGLDVVGRDDSFFAIGGDSLVATRMLARLAADGFAGAELSRLYATPVLADFAAGLSELPAGPSASTPIVPDPAHRYDPFPATDVQRAYWLGRRDDFALGGVGSHWYWEFDGSGVDIARLETAIGRLIERHDMLRAIFDEDGRQRVLARVPTFRIAVTYADADAVTRMRGTLAERVPDPHRWPLLEVRAVCYGGDRTAIGFSFDYIVLDALSIVRFFAELSTLYRDPAAELPPVDVTFRDYVVQAAPPPTVRATAETWWYERMADLPPAPALPLARDPNTVRRPRFRRREARLSPRQWQGLRDRARQAGVTPAGVLLAAYADVLGRWSASTDLTLNVTMFNRRDVHPHVDRVLGDFTSLALVPARLAPGQPWTATVRQVQQAMWESVEHGAVSALWVLRERLRRDRDAGPTMPVVFTSALGVADELTGLRFPFGELVHGLSQTPQVWLDNQVMERAGGLVVTWDGVDELFPPGLLDDAFDAYRRLLEWLAGASWEQSAPDLVPAAQRRVRDAVNDTAGPVPDSGLLDGFLDQAARRPHAPALAWGTGVGGMSYGALADSALRAARRLRDAGVATGDRVAVSLPRGPAQVVAVLGVLAAGASYLPLGVDQPADRRDRILRAAGVRLVVGLSGTTEVVPVVTLDLAVDPLPAPAAVDPDALAYTIFTSGSTGTPKGVEITHRAALNTIADVNRRFAVDADDRVLAVSALDFDLSVYDLFGILGAGGTVVLVADEDRHEPRKWAALVAARGVTVWNSAPALLDMLLTAADPGALRTLRLGLASGDWISLDLPDRFVAAAAPAARFVSLGGATEAAIWSNFHEVNTVEEGWRSIPYGRPLRNQRFRVVDPRGFDCPDWVAGELRIGGVGLAVGYHDAPDLTAASFVDGPDGRWYRTGDLGRYWPDGTLELLGRTDLQVKIGGYRVELGEVEAMTVRQPSVTGAVALAVPAARGRRLVLAVQAEPGHEPHPEDIRRQLAERLPGYMVPERIVAVNRFPVTANGKVDRARVARLFDDQPAGDGEPPDGPAETLLAAAWRQLLDTSHIGRRHNFLELGGDSLLATRLVELLRREHGVELALRDVLAAPTLAEMAAAVDQQLRLTSGPVDEGVL